MWDNMIGRHIRRSTRNLLIWNVILLVAIIAFFALSSRYWYNFLLGPFPMDREAVVNLQDDSGLQNLVTIRGDACIDTGEREITVTKKHGVEISRKESAKYLALFINGKVLIVKAPMDASAADVERRGVLDKFPDDKGAPPPPPRPNRRQDAGPAMPVVPVLLDSTITRTKGFIGLAVLIPLGLLNVANIFKAMSRFGNPQNHPLARKLLKYGDPQEVAQKIEDEYQSEDVQVVGPVTFTRSWMVRPTTFGVDAMFLGDSAWAYKAITQHYTNGIKTGKTFTANLCDIHGTQFGAQLKSEALVDEFVMAVANRVPWVFAGFRPDLEQMWKKDKPRLYELVEEERQKFADYVRQQREAPVLEEVKPEDDEPMDVEPA